MVRAGTLRNHWALILLLVFYVVLYVSALDRYPLIGVDEPWYADIPRTLAREGRLAKPTFEGFLGMENSAVSEPPVYVILLAAVFKLLGFGFVQARLLSVLCGLVVVVLLYAIVCKVFSQRVALWSAIALVVNPVFFHFMRNARQEPLVAVWFMCSLFWIVRRHLFLAGLFAGLAPLTHQTGSVSSAVVGFVVLWLAWKRKASWWMVALFGVGAAIPVLGGVVFVLSNYDAFFAQFGAFGAGKFSTLHWFWWHLLDFPQRVLDQGTSFMIGVLPGMVAVGLLCFFGVGRARAVGFMGVAWLILFGAFFPSRNQGYFLAVLPLLSAAVVLFLWHLRRKSVLLAGAVVLLLLFQPAVIAYKLYQYNDADYWSFCSKLRAVIPPGKFVVGYSPFLYCMDSYADKFVVKEAFEYLDDVLVRPGGSKYVFLTAVKNAMPDVIILDSETVKLVYEEELDALRKTCEYSVIEDTFYLSSPYGVTNNQTLVFRCSFNG